MAQCCFDCGLRWKSCRDFTRTQWPIPRWLFILYRLITLIYTLGYQIFSWVMYFDPRYYAFVTHLTFSLVALYEIAATGNLIIDLVLDAKDTPPKESTTLSLRYTIQWVLYDVLLTWSLIVAVVYWAFLFEQNTDAVSWVEDITIHLLPAAFSLLEVTVTATPCLFGHVVYPLTYGMMYLTFTLIYWAVSGGVVYFFLDYGENPVTSIVALLSLAAAIFVIYTVVWVVTILRQWVARKTNDCRCGSRAKYDVEKNTENQGHHSEGDEDEGIVAHIS
ncbi:protein rolling stone-like [Lytechinus pictus]|uniref:protein rolling stone-like n=1 Tax=Lytechinus pictus TaxID=7653 RepID=UPI0030B9CA37